MSLTVEYQAVSRWTAGPVVGLPSVVGCECVCVCVVKDMCTGIDDSNPHPTLHRDGVAVSRARCGGKEAPLSPPPWAAVD